MDYFEFSPSPVSDLWLFSFLILWQENLWLRGWAGAACFVVWVSHNQHKTFQKYLKPKKYPYKKGNSIPNMEQYPDNDSILSKYFVQL